jgi:hypothetical protein
MPQDSRRLSHARLIAVMWTLLALCAIWAGSMVISSARAAIDRTPPRATVDHQHHRATRSRKMAVKNHRHHHAARNYPRHPARTHIHHTARTGRHRVVHNRHHHRRVRPVKILRVKRAPVPTQIAPTPLRQPVVFGIYPGGAAGTVGPSGPVAPENPAQRLAALEQLKPANAPFVLHLYASYTGASGYSAAAQVGADISAYTAAGLQVELVLTYRPSDLNAAVDVPGFVQFVTSTVDQLGSNPGVVSLQVTNEANLDGAPDASDGYYPGAQDALIDGVIAAANERNADGYGQLKIGFNWAYATDAAQTSFWSHLGTHGGSAFVNDLDWVGIDAYPGTWGPALATNVSLSSAITQATTQALSALRYTYMPLAGIPASVPIHFSESGYPTGPGRTDAMQAIALTAEVEAVTDYSEAYNVNAYNGFDLRDADSSSSSFEDQYGLMTDSYTPKPAFGVYQQLVSSLS